MNWIREAPNEDQGRIHDKSGISVDSFVESQALDDGNADDAFERRMPVDAADQLVLKEEGEGKGGGGGLDGR